MQSSNNQTPFYVQFSLVLISIALLMTGLYLGKSIILPLCFAVLLASLLLPFLKFLERKGFPRIAAILVSLFSALITIGIVIYFLSTQIGKFLDDVPQLKKRTQEMVDSGQRWVQKSFNIGIRKQEEYIDETTEKMKDNGATIIGQTFITLTSIGSYLIFLPIYTFLLLYHKDTIRKFLAQVFNRSQKDTVTDVLYESQSIAQQYVTGLLIELGIVFVLNSIGFLVLGIRYAIFLALIAALLNLVPYIGMLIANIFCMLITLLSCQDYADVAWVFVVLMGVQLIDNNILMPMIVGSKVRINALAIILGVLVGGALCGVPGMFLAIPGLAFMKVVFERVDGLKPWAIILGDETTAEIESKNPVKRVFDKARKKKTSS